MTVADVLSLVINGLELLVISIFFVYVMFKGIKQKSYPKIMLGISFASGALAVIFHLLVQEFGYGLLFYKLDRFFINLTTIGFVFTLLMLLFRQRKKQLFLVYFIVPPLLLIPFIFTEESLLGTLSLVISIPTTVILLSGFSYIYYKSRVKPALVFFLAIILLAFSGFYSRIDPFFWSHIARTCAFVLIFLSFEFGRMFK